MLLNTSANAKEIYANIMICQLHIRESTRLKIKINHEKQKIARDGTPLLIYCVKRRDAKINGLNYSCKITANVN